jgi:Bifunctional DNA primase/polymerase, N-terminal
LASTKLTPEEQSAILYWPEIADIPIIDKVNSKTKQVWNSGWSNIDFSKVDFRTKLANGDYDDGIAILTGKTLTGRYAKYLAVVDFDGMDAIEEWFGHDNTWDHVLVAAKSTRIEWHQDKSRLHMFLLIDRSIASRKIHTRNSLLEIRCENRLIFVSPSIHKEGKRYTPIKTSEIAVLSGKKLLQLEAKIDSFCQGYMSDKNNQAYTKWLEDPVNYSKLGVGQGRHNGLVHLGTTYFYRHHGDWRGLSDDQRRAKLWEWNTKLAVQKPEAEFNSIWKWIVEKHRRSRDELHERLEEKRRHEQTALGFDKSYTFAIYHDNVKASLDGNFWTEIGKNPNKWIVADPKMMVIYKAHQYEYEVTTDYGSEDVKEKVCKLSVDNIIIRSVPLSITKHESPLDFLNVQTNYTVQFKDTTGKTFTLVRMSLMQIMEYLKDNGYVMSGYGATEALSAIITAFREDGKLQVEKSVSFEGYYYCDGDIQRSGVENKHPKRTREECKVTIDFLEKWSGFYIYNGIDRRDVVATGIKWTIIAPFNFVLKQLTRKYMNGISFSGERDGGKSAMSEAMLEIHGNFTDKSVAEQSHTIAYNGLMQKRRHELRILGDWTINYICDNRQELLLSKKYDAYQLMDIVIRKFDEFAGVEFPEWLGRWIAETSLDELDVDEEGIIRAILFNHIHEVLRQNAHLLDIRSDGEISLENRLRLCLEKDLPCFIRRKIENNTEVFDIDSSILMLFEIKLPDMTLKRLGEKMGLDYHHTKHRWVLRCTRDDLWKFLL